MSESPELHALAATVRDLEARIAIHELLARYGRALDEWDAAEVRTLIAPDVVARHDAVAPPFRGVETIITIMEELRPKARAVQHYITNTHVELHAGGNSATARAFVLAVHDTGEALLPAGGAYRMEVARAGTRHGWQIREIEVTETWFDPRILSELYDRSPMRAGAADPKSS